VFPLTEKRWIRIISIHRETLFSGGFQHESRFNQMFANGRYVSWYCCLKVMKGKKLAFNGITEDIEIIGINTCGSVPARKQ
jgi:hypothetical protein